MQVGIDKYTLFTDYSHTDNFRQQLIIKEGPSEAKERDIKEMISKSVIYIDIKYLYYKEESL
jgi:hypothetical protein